MKILLIGEYSRLHNSLKEGLLKLGHEVLLVSNRDSFKNYPVDINIDARFVNKYIPLFIRKLIYKLTKIDIISFEIAHNFNKVLPKLKDFDVIQFINEDALSITPKIQIKLLDKLINQNKVAFLLSCGDDYISINYYLKNKESYSILTPYLNNTKLSKVYHYSLKYTTKPYLELHNYLLKNVNGIIASDLDYHIPLKNHKSYLGLIPNPINVDVLSYIDNPVRDKIIIFHGINSKNYIKKGSLFFDHALKIIQKKYPEKVIVKVTKNLPYSDYIRIYNEAHIILDQVYAYDQGYNALEAMAKGKVVFTGAEQEWLDYYNLEENTVAINALPNTEQIVSKLSWLIENPEKIEEISKNARAFIEKKHHYVSIAKKYVETWQQHSKS